MTLEEVLVIIKYFNYIKLVIDDVVYYDDTETNPNIGHQKQCWIEAYNILNQIDKSLLVKDINIKIEQEHHGNITITTKR